MADKGTTMVLKVDLQCCSCYKEIKKLLLKFPEIKSQSYDEKQNTVTITVVSSKPEKIRDKLLCEGRKVIISIEIKKPPEPKPADTPKPKPPDPPKPKEIISLVPIPVPTYVFCVCCGPCSRGCGGGPSHHGCGRPVPCCEQHDCYGDGCSCGGGGPCHHRCGRPVPCCEQHDC